MATLAQLIGQKYFVINVRICKIPLLLKLIHISKVEKKKHVNILKKIIKSKDLAPLKKNLKNYRKKISVTFLEK